MEYQSFMLMLLLGQFITFVLCDTTYNAAHHISNKIKYEGHSKHYGSPKINLANGLHDDFYSETCPRAESIVRKITQRHVRKNPDLPAKLLRLHFHDCFVRGCDGSVLLNSTANSKAEKDNIFSRTLGGFDVIDEIKTEVEKECEGIVSCADILALAARDAISFRYNRPFWRVPTGRRDGTISLLDDVDTDIPRPNLFFSLQDNIFAKKGLSVRDLVTLSGAHTIGKSRCSSFDFRLYNFTDEPITQQDGALNKTYASYLKTICKDPILDRFIALEMDPGSARSFDTHYYINLKQNRGLLFTDSQLHVNGTRITKEIIEELLQPGRFFDEFAISMLRMGAIDVKTGTQGQIRRKCSLVN